MSQDDSDDSYYKNDDFSDDNQNEDNVSETNEEKQIKDELENMELSKVLQIQSKFNMKEKYKNTSIDPKKRSSTNNKNKSNDNEEVYKDNNAPKEFSAKVKPKRKKKDFKKAIKRDPRFDDLSGKLNTERYENNYGFVKDMAVDYIDKVNLLKKKRKHKIDDTEYELIKKQDNFVKGWIKKKEYNENKSSIKKEINKENDERESKGEKKIFLKKKMLNELLHTSQSEKRKKEDYKKFIKKEKHKEMKKIRRDEKLIKR